jgi:hypothetical protein
VPATRTARRESDVRSGSYAGIVLPNRMLDHAQSVANPPSSAIVTRTPRPGCYRSPAVSGFSG